MKIKFSKNNIFRLFVLLFEFVLFCGSIFLAVKYKDNFYYLFSILIFIASVQNLKGKKANVSVPLNQVINKPIKNRVSLIETFKKRFKLPQKKITFTHSKGNLKLIIIILLALVISVLSIFFLKDQNIKSNVLIEYYSRLAKLFVHLWWAFVSVVLLMTYFLTKKNKKGDGIKNKIRQIGKNISLSIIAIVFGAILSFIFTYIFASIFLFVISTASIISPSILGVKTDPTQIVNSINNNSDVPSFAQASENLKKSVAINTKFILNDNSFFLNVVLSSFPNIMFSQIRIPNKEVFLIGNTIFVKSLDKNSLEQILPTVAKKYVAKVFNPRYIKDLPNISIVSRQEYLKYRDDKINEELSEIQDLINDIKKELATISSYISKGKSNIAMYNEYIRQSTSYRDSEYQYCTTATSTYYGYYSYYTYRKYSDDYCRSQWNNREQEIANYRDLISKEQSTLAYNQGVYADYKKYIDDLGSYQDFVDSYKDQAPYELGLFEPEKDIKIVLDTIDKKSLADFIATLVHEYLHYTSYVSEERSLPQFFEEGLTEMFGRRIVKNTIGINTNVGYPLVTKTIENIADKVGVSGLEEIYFTKNSNELVLLLDNKFGKDFYSDSENFFILIPYLPEDKALKYANNIMLKIGSPSLTKDDYYSSESTY